MISYFRPNDLKKCVESIVTNTMVPFKLAIIDNSCGGIDECLNSIVDDRIAIYKNTKNLGKGKGFMKWYNTIMKNDNNDLFVSIDPDLLVPPEWLINMLRTAYTIKNLGVLAPVLIKNHGDTFTKQLASNRLVMHRKTKESGFVGSSSLYKNRHTAGPLFIINKKFFNNVGGYVQTQLYGNDDGELCKAAHKNNKFIGIDTTTHVVHLDNDNTNEYQQWKVRNVNKDVDGLGYWDQNQNQHNND